MHMHIDMDMDMDMCTYMWLCSDACVCTSDDMAVTFLRTCAWACHLAARHLTSLSNPTPLRPPSAQIRDQGSALTAYLLRARVFALTQPSMPADAEAEDMAMPEPSPLDNDIKGPLEDKEKDMKMVMLMSSSNGELSILTDSQAGNSMTVPEPLRLNCAKLTYLLTITQAVQPRSARLTYSLTH